MTKEKIKFVDLSSELKAGIYGGWIILGYLLLALLIGIIVDLTRFL